MPLTAAPSAGPPRKDMAGPTVSSRTRKSIEAVAPDWSRAVTVIAPEACVLFGSSVNTG
jgi:hypothetical protein